MRAPKGRLTTKLSQPEVVDEFMLKLKHPLKKVAEELRQIILSAGKTVGEEIFWNAPSFFYTGKMKPFNPKEYRRFIVGFNFFRKDCVRLIFRNRTLEPRRRQFHIRRIPCLLEPLFNPRRILFAALCPHRLHQAKERPAVFAVFFQVFPIDGLRFA